MVLLDAPTYPGVVVACQPLAMLAVTQKKKTGRGRERNDRLLVVPANAPRAPRNLRDLSPRVLRELEQFFVAATALEDKALHLLGWRSAAEAKALVRRVQKG